MKGNQELSKLFVPVQELKLELQADCFKFCQIEQFQDLCLLGLYQQLINS